MVFAVPGIPASDPRRTQLSVMTHVLGGGMSSRLFQTVRERNGLCYSIYSHHAGFDDTGLFAIATATRPKDARKATSLAFKEFRKMASKRVAADELAAGEVGDGRQVVAIDGDGDRERPLLRQPLARAGCRSRRRTIAPRRS